MKRVWMMRARKCHARMLFSCTMNIRALHEIKLQMRQNEWIMPTGRDDRQRMLWQLTAKGQSFGKQHTGQ